MKPSFLEGVVLAAVASVGGGCVWTLLGPVASLYTRGAVLILGLTFCYLRYLLRRSGARAGRVFSVLAVGGFALAVGWCTPNLAWCAAIALGFIWLVRSLLFHSSLVAAAADLGLTTFSYAAGLWAAINTHNVFLIVWCVLLAHATFVAIPGTVTSQRATRANTDSFKHAQRAAEAALRALSRST